MQIFETMPDSVAHIRGTQHYDHGEIVRTTWEWEGEPSWPFLVTHELEASVLPETWATLPWKVRKIGEVAGRGMSVYERYSD